MVTRIRVRLIITVVVLGLACPGVASATNPTQDTYGGIIGQQQSAGGKVDSDPSTQSTGGVSKATSRVSSGSLPFTGFELGLIGVAGMGLIGMGIAIRRASDSR
jgi:hypothetical protein